MASRIEDYALIGDTQTAALVSRQGSIDWFCAPRFDSSACFSALLGDERNGRWKLAPAGEVTRTVRRYRPGTLVLETDMETAEGAVRIIDFMPIRAKTVDVVRIVEGLRGRVRMRSELSVRFDFGEYRPWLRRQGAELHAVAGPDALVLHSGLWRNARPEPVADFAVEAGQSVGFVLAWYPSHLPPGPLVEWRGALRRTEAWWRSWSERLRYRGRWHEPVASSLRVLKALTYAPTGGLVAAPTTSLPEKLGGVRNWDYRYCWLRDAAYTLYALMLAGHDDEAVAFRDWMVRAIAGDPAQIQIMYGCAGERRLTEEELGGLPGYEGSRPVRIGNAAVHELQLDVYGEVMDCLHQTYHHHIPPDAAAWEMQKELMDYLENIWQLPDQGIWEMRGEGHQLTHSKVMAWVAFDRAVKAVERYGREGPAERWRAVRDRIHAEVCAKGFDSARGAFTQSFGSPGLDASLLMMPLVGFLPVRDPRVKGTIAAIERELMEGGLVRRYLQDSAQVDGLPGGEAAFLACSFWLADCYALQGRSAEAEALYLRLLALRNDVGLLSEEYDPTAGRMLGNFPQAFSHVGIINTAANLEREDPANRRRHEEERARSLAERNLPPFVI